jgi:hypothetical protein
MNEYEQKTVWTFNLPFERSPEDLEGKNVQNIIPPVMLACLSLLPVSGLVWLSTDAV